ncbi:hypothetical protein DNK06_23335 [Pseudomonas daroniae]|uniref:Lipoprotein n=1 Tax=Phytopseudomonas daroniae TaxID=2487519 RepID=A0A4Q9QGJ2_9GAMM|nr:MULTISPECIES: hypothetical protein [Pseudomonas]TBU71835.1 hypothetical protein DNK06_23335 [Pseudomonas daroniae]TBU78140.1 hypothetical protein DNK31_20350 [Pseudomonas sp. FRB 228]TBU87956.1 hypothetical protein DNJ99_20575 [Pseudomonas daroniae]
MIRKSMLVALLGFLLTGCAVYGDSGYGGGYRDYDRQYYPGAHVQRSQVYGTPRVYVYEDRRYDRRYAPPRHYAPPPPPRYFHQPGYDSRYHSRHDRNSRDYRPAPRPGWEGQRHHYQQQQRQRGAALQWQQRETPQRFQRSWEQRR